MACAFGIVFVSIGGFGLLIWVSEIVLRWVERSNTKFAVTLCRFIDGLF